MRLRMFALALAAMAFGMAGQASAQSRSGAGWWPWVGGSVHAPAREHGKKAERRARQAREEAIEHSRRGRDDDEDEDDDRDEVREHRRDHGEARDHRRGNGPPFCRNGQGHPVHGMEWCEEKGWAPASWQRVVYRSRLPNGPLRQPVLRDILGSVILGRLSDYSLQLGARGPLEGRSFYAGDASVLQLRAGAIPVAELTDLDRDGRVDLVLLANAR